jgi:energy-coupling factor transport system substrate-specific component
MSWGAWALLVVAAAVAAGFAWYERTRPPARVVALVAALAALAVVGRLAFAAIPNVKPTTDIVLFAGYALGAAPGFAVGAVAALASNVFLGQGPWTAWQMVGWGAVGLGGALLARALRGRELGRVPLAAACAAAGLAFGAWMDVYDWTLAARQDLDSYVAVSATSLPYNVTHAAGNVVFCLLIGPVFVRALRRYRRRFEVSWEPPARAGVPAACLLLGAAVALSAAGGQPGAARAAVPPRPADAPPAARALRPVPPRASAARAGTPAARALRYLAAAQRSDGGFGAAPGQASGDLFTGWAALGLAAAGRNPLDVRRRGGGSVVDYLRRRARGLRDVGELERTIMVLRAAGLSARRFAGRDLVGELLRRRRPSGAIAGDLSHTAFGMLALRAAGEAPGDASAAWLERAQSAGGGFGVAPGVPSDADMTGAVLQALATAGRAGGGPARRAAAYLRRNQHRDGGFGLGQGRSSNAQSTAYAVQGLLAIGGGRDVVARALAYLRRLQGRDGSIRYSRAGRQTPVWVTAQALMALERRVLPLRTVPRRRPRRTGRAAAARATASPQRSGPARPAPAGATPAARRHAGARAASTAPAKRAPRARERERVATRSLHDPSTTVSSRRASARSRAAARPSDAGGGPPAAALAGAGLGILAAVVVARRLMRRGRRVEPRSP